MRPTYLAQDDKKRRHDLYAERDISKLRILASENDSVSRKYLMSVCAAAIAEAVTYPLDLTKTRLQLQGEVAASAGAEKYRGMISTAVGIIKEEVLARSLIDARSVSYVASSVLRVFSCCGEASRQPCCAMPSTRGPG